MEEAFVKSLMGSGGNEGRTVTESQEVIFVFLGVREDTSSTQCHISRSLQSRVAVSEKAAISRGGDQRTLSVEQGHLWHTPAGEKVFNCLEITVLYLILWTSHRESIIC